MTFYALHLAGKELERLSLLENACKALNIKFEALTPRSFDFSKSSPVKKGDIVDNKEIVVINPESVILKDAQKEYIVKLKGVLDK